VGLRCFVVAPLGEVGSQDWVEVALHGSVWVEALLLADLKGRQLLSEDFTGVPEIEGEVPDLSEVGEECLGVDVVVDLEDRVVSVAEDGESQA